eukprot:jgi/Botrbrau1/1520/Bobra.0107s0008.1
MERRSLVEKDQLISQVCNWGESYSSCYTEKHFLLELDLYRYAMRNATPACLEALLEAGCRSVWICRLAALEGNAAFLALAANWGCPCDLIALQFAACSGDLLLLMAAHSAALLQNGALFCSVGKLSDAEAGIRQAAYLAAREGHAACLGAFVGWFGKSAVSNYHASISGARGHLNCLQTLQRAGCLDVGAAADGAAKGVQLECLQYLLDLDPGLVHRPLLTFAVRWRAAKSEAQMACLEFLHHRGCQWSADGGEMVESAGSPEILRYCLERVRVRPWDKAMRRSIFRGSLDCMQLLYEAGYEQHRSREAKHHPAVYVVMYGMAQAYLLLAISRSGVPDAQLLDTVDAVRFGEDRLRYARELGAPFTIETTNTAAAMGDVGALRYALKNGAPWDATTFEAVIAASRGPSRFDMEVCLDWLECLRCLHEHARAAGLPEKCSQPSERAFASFLWKGRPGPTPAVLRYVCNHMGPTWATPLLESTAQKLAGWVAEYGGQRSQDVHWQVVLYLGQKLKQSLPAPLGELLAVRREGAAALAGVFFKAGRLAQGRGHPKLLALWGAMAGLPSDLRERIAFQAHLICCEAPCQLQAP